MRFFSNPRKPMILALARPDPKKNITTLVKAFGECRPLRELANLVCHFADYGEYSSIVNMALQIVILSPLHADIDYG